MKTRKEVVLCLFCMAFLCLIACGKKEGESQAIQMNSSSGLEEEESLAEMKCGIR